MTTRWRMAIGSLVATLSLGAGRAAAEPPVRERPPRPPIRASATVEVIDPARGVDEIISRVREQSERRGETAKERGRDESARPDDRDNRDNKEKEKDRRTSAATTPDRDRMRPERSDRAALRGDRERREPRRDDLGTRPVDRTRGTRRP